MDMMLCSADRHSLRWCLVSHVKVIRFESSLLKSVRNKTRHLPKFPLHIHGFILLFPTGGKWWMSSAPRAPFLVLGFTNHIFLLNGCGVLPICCPLCLYYCLFFVLQTVLLEWKLFTCFPMAFKYSYINPCFLLYYSICSHTDFIHA